MSESPKEEEVIIDQEKLLDDCLLEVKSHSYQVKNAIDNNKLRHCLKFSKLMLGTLKNAYLTPTGYYTLYMTIFDEMQYVYNYFKEEARRGRQIKYLYDTVQQCEDIIPRIYLLIVVGAVYIEAGQTIATEVIFDLLNIIKGVQNPLRGLFLRYFLLKMIKDKLPDKDNEFEKPGATFEESIKFILNNLDEMNRLWIRLSTGTTGNERIVREKERNELKVLVGENITRLSSLNGMTQDIYQKQVLPKIIDSLLDSRDQLSQQYLMECVIHAFPDEFNIHSMNLLLDTCTKLQQTVDVKSIFIALMDKLAKYVENGKDESSATETAGKIFAILKDTIDKIINEALTSSGGINSILELQAAFMKFTVKGCPGNEKLATVNHILSSSVNLVSRNRSEKINNEGIKLIGKILASALEAPLSLYEMPNFPELMKYLDFSSRTTLSLRIIDSLVSGISGVKLDNSEKMSLLVDFIRPLLEDSPDSGEFEKIQFEYEQNAVCKILFIISSNDPNNIYETLAVIKNVFLKGGAKRMQYTLPSLVNAYLSLAYGVSYAIAKENGFQDNHLQNQIHSDFLNMYNVHNIETVDLYTKFLNKVYNQINDAINLLIDVCPDKAFKSYLSMAIQINDIKIERNRFEEQCFNTLNSALNLLSGDKIDNNIKVHLINNLIGTVLTFSILSKDNFTVLTNSILTTCQSLIKRSDQCITILNCTNLFFNEIVLDKMKIKDCMVKAKRFADFAMTNPQNAILFIYILNKYLYFLDKCDKDDFIDFINVDVLNDLIELVKNHIQSMKVETKDNSALPELEEYYNNTINMISSKKKSGKKIYEQLLE